MKKAVEVCIKNLSQFDTRSVATLALAAHKLRLTEPLLWSTLEREGQKTIHKVKPKGFACHFIAFLSEPGRCSNEYRDKLVYNIPMNIRKLNPDLMTTCFELTQKHGLVSQYLFDHHFFMLIWKRLHWFGPKNYARIIRVLTEQKFSVRFLNSL